MDKSKWEYKKLGEVCDAIYSGGTPKRSVREYWNGDIPWIKISDLNGSYVSSCDEFITKDGLNNSSAKLLPKGTILYSIFATIGAIGILDINATTNQAIAGIIVKKEYNREYIFYVLRSLRKYFEGISKGVAQNNINLSILKNVVIPIPSSSTQQQIVSELDQLNELISLKQQQLKEYDALAQSIFYEMFGDPIINDKGFPIEKLSNVCLKITDGTHNSPKNYSVGDYMYITAKNIKKDGFDFKDISYLSADLHKTIYSRCDPKKGDVLYIKDGATTGIAMVNPLEEEFSLLSSVALLRPCLKLNSYYLRDLLNTPSEYKEIRANMGGAAITRLTIKKIEKIKIPLPPLTLQQSFAERVRAIERQKALVKQSIAEVQTLLDSRMQEYFG